MKNRSTPPPLLVELANALAEHNANSIQVTSCAYAQEWAKAIEFINAGRSAADKAETLIIQYLNTRPDASIH